MKQNAISQHLILLFIIQEKLAIKKRLSIF